MISVSAGTIRVGAVGDLMLGDSAICVGYGLRTQYAAAPGNLFALVESHLSSYDLLFGNLEAVLSLTGFDPHDLSAAQMRGDPAFAAELKRVGFDVLSVANNHASQHGSRAFWEMVGHLRDAGITCCGLRGSDGWCAEPALMRRNGARIGVLAYCLRPRQYGEGVPPFAEAKPDEIIADVNRLRPEVDYIVVSLHWGEEFVTEPSVDEVALGHSIIDAGAILVIGHHPHVIRPVERYRSGIVAYSLGNFATDMVWQPELREGLILTCRLAPGSAPNVQIIRTRVDEQYRPEAIEVISSPCLAPQQGLGEEVYARAVTESLRAQQLAAYGYALRNLRRYPVSILAQLATQTARNKVGGLLTQIMGKRLV